MSNLFSKMQDFVESKRKNMSSKNVALNIFDFLKKKAFLESSCKSFFCKPNLDLSHLSCRDAYLKEREDSDRFFLIIENSFMNIENIILFKKYFYKKDLKNNLFLEKGFKGINMNIMDYSLNLENFYCVFLNNVEYFNFNSIKKNIEYFCFFMTEMHENIYSNIFNPIFDDVNNMIKLKSHLLQDLINQPLGLLL